MEDTFASVHQRLKKILEDDKDMHVEEQYHVIDVRGDGPKETAAKYFFTFSVDYPRRELDMLSREESIVSEISDHEDVEEVEFLRERTPKLVVFTEYEGR